MNKAKIIKKIVRLAPLVTMVAFSCSPLAYAQLSNSSATQVNINQAPSSNGSPFGGFSLVKCDGPDISGVGANTQLTVTIGGQQRTGTPNQLMSSGYTACDFQGLMTQVQFLINVMIVLGVVAAICIAVYAGFLYMTGTQENIKKAKGIFPKLAWGFIIMLTAWFIVYQILVWLTGSAGFLSGSGS